MSYDSLTTGAQAPILWLPCGDNLASTVVDDPNSETDGTLNGGDTTADKYLGAAQGPNFSHLRNLGFGLNGSDDYVSRPALDALNGAAERSVSFWYRSSGSTNQGLVDYGTTNFNNGGGSISLAAAGDVTGAPNGGGEGGIYFGFWSNDVYVPYTEAVVMDGNWHHVVMTLDDESILRVYFDGVEREDDIYFYTSSNWNTISYPADLENIGTNSEEFFFGRSRVSLWSNGSAFLNGDICDLRVYSFVLDSDNIADLRSGPDAPVEGPSLGFSLDMRSLGGRKYQV